MNNERHSAQKRRVSAWAEDSAKTKEGRVNILETEPIYEYVLRDHLGNTRVTFTTKHDIETFTANLEEVNATEEQSTFNNYNSFVNPMNHTPGGERVHILNGGYNGQVGLAKSFAVVPGDTIKAKVYAKYVNTTGNPGNLANFALALTQAFNLTSVMTGEAGTMYETLNDFGSIIAAGGRDDEENAPKGFVNILVFNEDFELKDFAYQQVDAGSTTTHELLSIESAIRQPGYAYVFLSNENPTEIQIGFDDYEVTHIHSAVIQHSAFYPFGLTYDNYQKEGSLEQRWKFQKQEHINDLGLGWVSFKWRNHMPDIGRFFNVDPLSEKYYYNSPYAFSENRVIDGRELEGLEWKSIKSENPDGSRKVQFQLTLTVKNSSSMSASEVGLAAESIAAQIESSYQGYDKESNTAYSTSVLLVFGGDKGDMTLEFVNEGSVLNRDTQKPYPVSFGIQGAVNQKDGDSQQNRIQVQTNADDVTKTGAHEAGHTAGLADPSTSNKSKDRNGLPLGEGNLMNQGDAKGTKINGAQLKHMEKTIDDDKAKRNN